MSLTPGEYDCNEEVGIDEQEKDIADQVLVNILKMSGIERSFQVLFSRGVQKMNLFSGPKYIQT